MRGFRVAAYVTILAAKANGFVTAPHPSRSWERTEKYSPVSSRLNLSGPSPDPERLKQIMQEEAMNPDNMKKSAELMKNMKPEMIDEMLQDLDNMPEAQRKQMEAMGMNPAIMRQSIEAMKSNPKMVEEMGKMLDHLTPEEILERSRQAQAALSGKTQETNRDASTLSARQ